MQYFSVAPLVLSAIVTEAAALTVLVSGECVGVETVPPVHDPSHATRFQVLVAVAT
jgi:hypothetical protein